MVLLLLPSRQTGHSTQQPRGQTSSSRLVAGMSLLSLLLTVVLCLVVVTRRRGTLGRVGTWRTWRTLGRVGTWRTWRTWRIGRSSTRVRKLRWRILVLGRRVRDVRACLCRRVGGLGRVWRLRGSARLGRIVVGLRGRVRRVAR